VHQVGFSLHKYIELHGQENIQFRPYMFSGCKYLHNFVVNVASVGNNNCEHMNSASSALVHERARAHVCVCVCLGGGVTSSDPDQSIGIFLVFTTALCQCCDCCPDIRNFMNF
jgi:hypothetical protein